LRRFVFYCIPPTPNGDLHLGHLSGPYLGADVLARHLRTVGHDVQVLTGLDDYQSYVYRKSMEVSRPPEEVLAEFSQKIRNTWLGASINHNMIVSTYNNATYGEFVKNCFGGSFSSKVLQRRRVNHLYSRVSGFAYQGTVMGVCPWCGEPSDGNICETCSLPNECTNLSGVRSALREDELYEAAVSRRFVSLQESDVVRDLKEWHETVHCNRAMRDYFKRFWSSGIPDVSVTHQANWGLDLNGDRERIDVWAEMAFGFLFYAHQMTGNWQSVWKGQREVGIFFGFDNSFYTSILFPTLWKVFDSGIELPKFLFMNHFLLLDGEKFSTSRSHAIWGSDFFRKANVSWGRLYLCGMRHEDRQANFSLREYESFEVKMTQLWASAVSNLRNFNAQKRVAGDLIRHDYLSDLPSQLLSKISADLALIKMAMDPCDYRLGEASRALQRVFDYVLGFCGTVSIARSRDAKARFGLLAGLCEFAKPWMPSIVSTCTPYNRDTNVQEEQLLPQMRARLSDEICI
jgi:methionyl-tRNA synthetase